MQLLRPLLALAIPIFIGGAVQTSYHLINAFWVGRLGAEAVAIVTLSFPVNILMISVGSGLSLAGTILISQYFGARESAKVGHTASQTLTGLTIFSLALSAIGYFLAPAIAHLLGVAETVMADTVTYMRISFAGTLFVFLNLGYQSILRGIGDSKAPLKIILLSVVVNAALDPLLIFGWGPIEAQGVIGAAYATLITQIISAGAGIHLMLQPRFGLTVTLDRLKPDWSVITKLLRLGLPASVEQTTQALSMSIMTLLVGQFGLVALAAYGMVSRLLIFLIIPVLSVSMAVSIMAGQSIGSGNAKHAVRIGTSASMFNFALMLLVAMLFFVFARPIMHIFIPYDETLLTAASIALKMFALSFPFSGLQMALTGAFRGASDTFNTMLMTLMGVWAVQLPLAFVLSHYTGMGELGLWLSAPLAGFINATVALVYFKSKYWLRKTAVTDSQPSAVQTSAAAGSE
nr:MATE family efflux transporter [Aestuariicella hydrocarbonica]